MSGLQPEQESRGATGEQTNAASESRDAPGDQSRGAELSGRDLTLQYPGGDEPVIDGESIAALRGEVTALVGPNGSGKSTLLKALSDHLSPESGSVLLDGRRLDAMDDGAIARELCRLSQDSHAPAGITVEQLVYHGRYPHRGFFERVGESDREAVDRAIELAGCGHLRDREVGNLSGGQKQLAWIAMVLAQETDVLLLDEPTTFLDLHHQLAVMEIVETLRAERDVTVVVVLHDVQQAARLADRIVVLDGGEIAACGPPSDVVTESLLADVFGIEAIVDETPRGPRIEPLRPRRGDAEADDGTDSDAAESEK